MVSISSCPLHMNFAVDTAKCYFIFSRSFYEMSVSIVNVYQSLLVTLFYRHFYLLISASIQFADRVIQLGQHARVDQFHYSRDDLLSLNISISPISNSLCATVNSLGLHASNQLCFRRKSRKRNHKRTSEKGQIHSIQVLISSRSPKLTNRKASGKPNRANLINVPILSSLSESRFSNNSIRISLFNARSIGTSVKRSEINNFILDHQIDIFVSLYCRNLVERCWR